MGDVLVANKEQLQLKLDRGQALMKGQEGSPLLWWGLAELCMEVSFGS